MGLIEGISAWLKQPFQSGQSAWKWVLFVGLIIVACYADHLILLHIVSEAKEVVE